VRRFMRSTQIPTPPNGCPGSYSTFLHFAVSNIEQAIKLNIHRPFELAKCDHFALWESYWGGTSIASVLKVFDFSGSIHR